MRYAKKAILAAFVTILALILGVSYWVLVASPYDLPQGPLVFERLKPPSSGTLFDGSGYAISYLQRNDPTAFYKHLDQIDKKLRDYVVMLEDDKFYTHNGFDVGEINNSFWKNFKAGKVKRGGSGITQQLAKNLFLDQQRSYTRKLYEVPWTLKIESSLSKRQILELYLNSIEWGPGLAGAESAARYFFGKSCSSLTPGEAMYLALIIPSPQRFNIIKNPHAIKSLETKRRWFVDRLVSEKRIPYSEKQDYLTMTFGVLPIDSPERKFLAPLPSAFRLPEWAEFLKPYLKGRSPKVTIIKAVQLKGLEPSAWTLIDDPTPDHAGATTWCATTGEQLSGYWIFGDAKVPTPLLEQQLAQLGSELNPCEGIDVSRSVSP